MAYETLTEETQGIVASIKRIIDEKRADIGQHKHGIGWEYTGSDLLNLTDKLKNELNNSDFQVFKINVLHLVHNGSIQNRTGHVLVFPLNGSANFAPDEPLLACHHIEKERTIYGDHLDLIIVSLKKR
ncbi:hypothetical protein BDV32DRAFT_90592 [Aspergillus pseudonomiae]|uniref:Uncharacterized protein n=1 Tax=Aspergillus pseudonomiae TaxID=1506151 RepID=A0A5N6HQW3_9EURO|nr:uncharacterized protein BDV37DRAFT_289894 [Aspergillus pseudonomiae]KAB8256806.1 hypothetical protein BDV32DRAFT_90592 [Aspergillus pseudonomiae]KAE8396885.1 hypothetical protein BDV37DRAFT_289894 [Aspergillus pseudonomiae]